MWVVTHVLAGLGLAAALDAAGAPWWAILMAVLAAHVLMDLVPHWDYTVSRHPLAYGVLDVAGCVAAFLLCWRGLGWPLWLALMGPVSGAPDTDVLVAVLRGGHVRKVFPSHWRRFPHGRSGPVWGIGVQAAVMAVSALAAVAFGP